MNSLNSQIEFSFKTHQKLFMAAGIILLAAIFILFSQLTIIVGSSLLLFLVLDPIVKQFEKRGLSRTTGTVIVFGLISISVYFAGYYFIPIFFGQLHSLGETFKNISLQNEILSIELFLRKIFVTLPPGIISQKLEHFFESSIELFFFEATKLLPDLVSLMLSLFVIPFVTFFMVKDRKKIAISLLGILPNKYFELTYWIIKKISEQLGLYVRGWLIDASFIGIACGLSFHLIGIENAIALGIIAGIGHLIPYFGPIVGGLPAILISIIQNGNLHDVPLILFVLLLVYIIDNGIVEPIVFSKSIDIHPIIIILLIIAGSQVFGVVGMLLAVPVATVIKTAVKEIYFAFKNYKIARL